MKVAHRARMRAKLSMAPATRAKVAFGEAFGRRIRWFGFDMGVAHDVPYSRSLGTLQYTGRASFAATAAHLHAWLQRDIADARAQGCSALEVHDELMFFAPAGEDCWTTLADFNASLPPGAAPARGVTIPPGQKLSVMGPDGEWRVIGTTV